MTMKRERDSLIERCIARDTTLGSIHVKAELDRLARQVRKLKKTINLEPYHDTKFGYCTAIDNVLEIIKERKQ